MGNIISGEMVPQDPKGWHPHPKVYKSAPYSVERPGVKASKGETAPRVNLRSKDGLITQPEEGVDTVYDIVKRGASKFGNAKCVGYRKIVKLHEENKKVKKVIDGKEQEVDKKWTYSELSSYHYYSFIEYESMVHKVGSGLRKLGMKAEDRLHIFAATTPFWLAMAHGTFKHPTLHVSH